MVRGVASSTIVPTASGDSGEGIPAQQPPVSSSEIKELGEYAFEEEKADAAASSKADLESEKYLQAAFHSQPSTAIPPVQPANSNEEGGSSRKSNPKQQQKSGTNKSLRKRPQSAVVQKQKTAELTKNYMELARDFRQLQPFTRRPDSKYPTGTLCVYCANSRPTSVFFPCQHMCVCNDCIKSSNISTDHSSSTDWCACPVCMADIRLILPHSGKEEERYWRWALEIKPNLPSQFKQGFKEAGKRLNKSATPTPTSRNSFVTRFRRTSNSPKANAPVIGRRHSWQPGGVTTVEKVAASNEHDEARNCSIL